MKRVVLVSIILILGLAGNGFTETVTNQQILEKLNSLEVKIARVEEGQKSLQKQIDGLDNNLSARIDSLDKRIDDLRNLGTVHFSVKACG